MEEKRREEKRREEKRREGNTMVLVNCLSFKFFISLLSFILLFSISCKSNPNQTAKKHSKSELEGTWKSSSGFNFDIFIASDGALLQERGNVKNKSAAIGKVDDTFDGYPYTIRLTGTNNYDVSKNAYSGTVTFHSATNLDFYFDGITYKDTGSFYKYHDKLIIGNLECGKKDISSWVDW